MNRNHRLAKRLLTSSGKQTLFTSSTSAQGKRKINVLTFLLAGLLSLPGLPKTTAAQAADSDNSVNITSLQLLSALLGGGVPRSSTNAGGGSQRVAVDWNVVVLKEARLEGFEVAVTATLSNGQSLNQRQSFGSNARRAEFTLNLPSANQSNGNNANTQGNNPRNPIQDFKELELKENGNTPSNTPPVDCNTKCSRLGGAKRQNCLDECAKSTTRPAGPTKKEFLSSNSGPGLGNSFAPQIQATTKEKGIAPPAAVQAIVITVVSANITARFSRNTEAFATRSFVPSNAGSDLLPSGNAQGVSMSITRLSDLLKIPAKAKECPTGHDCFEMVVQARGAGASFTVNFEAVYANNQRVNVSPFTVSSLATPIRVKVRRPNATAALASVTANVKGTIVEPFTRTDTETTQQQKLQLPNQAIKK